MAMPVISDPEHPLFETARDGWIDWTEEDAWRECYLQRPRVYTDSAAHPAYHRDFIRNTEQQREQADAETAQERPGTDASPTRR